MKRQAIILITHIKCAGCFNRIDQLFRTHHAEHVKLDATTLKAHFIFNDEELLLSNLLQDLADASYPSYLLLNEPLDEISIA